MSSQSLSLLRPAFLKNYIDTVKHLNVKRVGMVVAAIAALFAIYIYATFNPENTFFPKCPFFWATGLKCPGCGSQRALHQLLHFHVKAAFQYNAFLVLSIPIIIFLAAGSLLWKRFPKLEAASRSTVFSWTITVFILLWWLLRNVFGW